MYLRRHLTISLRKELQKFIRRYKIVYFYVKIGLWILTTNFTKIALMKEEQVPKVNWMKYYSTCEMAGAVGSSVETLRYYKNKRGSLFEKR